MICFAGVETRAAMGRTVRLKLSFKADRHVLNLLLSAFERIGAAKKIPGIDLHAGLVRKYCHFSFGHADSGCHGQFMPAERFFFTAV